ncbi:hypothetical protein QN277_015014 [Acacia crassicarpa]|uniref:PB1 domain-containing protein n=1 Tax=Acacia crassicarpa TaxID=499986 RepID=A0AAE1MTQ5_9FABA|nr:hypothetical protein QN277_015014 [Acacia crassicarpa]
MENHPVAHSQPDSRNSSPHSQEGDIENPSMDDPLSTTTTNNNSHKVKFMCSYGGNIQFRSHDNQLAYIGGETKIITVDRSIKFSAVIAKLSSLYSADVFVKYQLPGEDLDALISITNDEDLEHMMVEYDLCQRALVKAARLRLFLFPPKPSAPTSFESNDLKPEQQWFVDALNSVHIPHVKGSSSSAPANQDFLSGLDYRYSVVSATKLPDSVTNAEANCSPTGTDGGSSEDRQIAAGEQAGSPTEIQKQVEESQRLNLEKNERSTLLKGNEGNGKVNNETMDHYSHQKNNPEKKDMTPSVHTVQSPVSIPGYAAVYSPQSASYSVAASAPVTEPLLYMIAPAVMYHAPALRAVNGPTVGQPYYRVPRMVQTGEYNGAPLASLSLSHSQSRIGANGVETSSIVQPKVEVVAEPAAGYPQMVYGDGGRQIFIATPATWGGMVPPPRQEVVAAGTGSDIGTQGGSGTQNQEVKVSNKAASAV